MAAAAKPAISTNTGTNGTSTFITTQPSNTENKVPSSPPLPPPPEQTNENENYAVTEL